MARFKNEIFGRLNFGIFTRIVHLKNKTIVNWLYVIVDNQLIGKSEIPPMKPYS